VRTARSVRGVPANARYFLEAPAFWPSPVSFSRMDKPPCLHEAKKMFKTGHRVLFKPVVFQLQLRGTIDPNPTVAGPPPTHNLLLLPMRIYRHCQRGRNGYLRICRCICSFLIKRLANLLGGYSYVALVHPLRSQLFP
jgi:hypothetical protein